MDSSPARREVRREHDGELMGFVQAAGDEWLPVAVFGAAIGDAADVETAERVVLERGLSVLADDWECLQHDDWVRCQIVEASVDRVTLITGQFVFDPTTRFTMAAPVDGNLRLR